ncbi:hypothetical protein LUX29_19350 [Aureimonas altamirensis]|uniref:hypothetical protein n=1 Tax=Aureimonas altamirensis TaxID=370622 RepID=UPI001E5D01F5|nr:hypothetical protein [Aureimonas altamirensis]UHD45143.1 hypothetical protein LUX29_19350 [Aureimonas altamirensis]
MTGLSHRLRDRIATGVLVTALFASLAIAVWASLQLMEERRDNRAIAALGSGMPVETSSQRAEVLFAQSRQLLRRGRPDEAEALSPALAMAGNAGLAAAHAYNLGNGRLRQAFTMVEDNRIDAAIPVVRVAQEDYRRALRLNPADFDAKWNLDLASRLVRAFPRAAPDEEEDGTRPRNIWTDLPGLPRGLP